MPDVNFYGSGNCYDIKKIAYDLAMLYAKSKLDHMLQTEFDFDKGLVPVEVEQAQYLYNQFFIALEYYTNTSPEDTEFFL